MRSVARLSCRRQAEKARSKGEYDAMVEHGRLLKQLATGVFLEYMRRL